MIDKRLLTDKVTVKKVRSDDFFGDESYSLPIILSHVRFDRKVVRSGVNNATSNERGGTIFVYPKYNPIKIDDSWLNAIVKDNHGEYTVVGYSVNYLGRKVFSYEIEVV